MFYLAINNILLMVFGWLAFPIIINAAKELKTMREVQKWARDVGVDPDFETKDDYLDALYEYEKWVHNC